MAWGIVSFVDVSGASWPGTDKSVLWLSVVR